jgi:hypothetical protein
MLYYGDLDDGLQRQVERSVVIAIFSAKKREPGQGAQRRDSTTQMIEFFVFPELILFQNFNVISGFHSYFRIWV